MSAPGTVNEYGISSKQGEQHRASGGRGVSKLINAYWLLPQAPWSLMTSGSRLRSADLAKQKTSDPPRSRSS